MTTKYGEIIDDFVGPCDKVYKLFVDYLRNPTFVKIKDEMNGSDTLSLYANQAPCMLIQEARYVLVFIYNDNEPLGTKKQLNDLLWVSLQLRTLPIGSYNVPLHPYNFIPCHELQQNAKIAKFNITKEASMYNCEQLPLVITLLHTKRKTEHDYQNNGNLLAAMVSWETIITWK